MSKDAESFIVAGIDGSVAADAAAHWAADEAHLRKSVLHLLFAYQIPVVGYPEYEYPPEFADAIRAAGQATLDRVAVEIADRYPDLDVRKTKKEADARLALVDESQKASMTVVGTRGKSRLAEVLLGSVALHLAAHSHSPVAVVPHSTSQSTRGPILVGTDGSPNSNAALGFAFDEAVTRGAELVVTLAWGDLTHQHFARRPAMHGTADEEADAVLDHELAVWCEKYPKVSFRKVIHRGSLAEGLLRHKDRSIDQPQLVVVGSRGRGGLSGLILGSTSHTVIIHSRCTVIVVRPSQ